MFDRVTVYSSYGNWTGPFVMLLVNMFVKVFGMEKAVWIVEANFFDKDEEDQFGEYVVK